MNEELNRAFEEISDDLLNEAAGYQKKRFPWVKSAVTMVGVVIAWIAIWSAFDFKPPFIVPDPSDPVLQGTAPSTAPTVPTIPPTAPTSPSPPLTPTLMYFSGLAAEPSYPKKTNIHAEQMFDIYHDLNNFWHTSIPEFLSSSGNRAYSPTNVYMAMAMLAQTSSGQSQQQILDLLGVETIEDLQSQVRNIWNAHYIYDNHSKLLLGNSLWLDSNFHYNPEIVKALADSYFASVYAGDLGSDEMNETLRQWVDSQTENLLQEDSSNLELDPNTVFALASTVYFKADWNQPFSESKTFNQTFHGTNGDVSIPFLHSSTASAYYWGEDFTAVRMSLDWGNSMWIILPDEGKKPDDLLESGAYLSTVLPTEVVKNVSYPTIHLSMPKFDISEKRDLVNGMKNLGITDVFSPYTSNFSSFTDENIYVDKIEHTVRVSVDEDGILGAAYTIVDAPSYGIPPEDEVDFVVDRPFLFLVTSYHGFPLFAGVVEQP